MLKNLRKRPLMKWQVMDMTRTKASATRIMYSLLRFRTSRQHKESNIKPSRECNERTVTRLKSHGQHRAWIEQKFLQLHPEEADFLCSLLMGASQLWWTRAGLMR